MTDLVRQTYQVLGEGAGVASLLVALIALIGAIAAALVAYLTSARSVYVTAITVERSKWIEKLRDSMSCASSLMVKVSNRLQFFSGRLGGGPEVTSKEMVDSLEALSEVIAKIQLQLNPFGVVDRNILRLVEAMSFAHDTEFELIQDADRLLIGHAQWLLKIEWEKVKYEARGWLYRFSHVGWEARRLGRYQEWAAAEGSIEAVVERFAKEAGKRADKSPHGAKHEPRTP